MSGEAGQWAITEEFSQRLGCGVITAVLLPLWFLVMVFVVPANLALWLSAALFLLSAGFAVAALRRSRRLPRAVRLEADGRLVTTSRRGQQTASVAGLRRVDVGTSLGVWPVRLTFADGSVLRLPRDLDDLPGLLAALQRANPAVVVTDHNPAAAPGAATTGPTHATHPTDPAGSTGAGPGGERP